MGRPADGRKPEEEVAGERRRNGISDDEHHSFSGETGEETESTDYHNVLDFPPELSLSVL